MLTVKGRRLRRFRGSRRGAQFPNDIAFILQGVLVTRVLAAVPSTSWGSFWEVLPKSLVPGHATVGAHCCGA